jgi:hypothetical protein
MLILSERIFAHLADQASSVGFFSRFSLSHSLLNRCYSTMTREPEDQALAMANLRSRHPIPVFVAEPSAIATLLLLRLRGSETLADLAVGPLTSDSRILGLAEILGDGGRGGGGDTGVEAHNGLISGRSCDPRGAAGTAEVGLEGKQRGNWGGSIKNFLLN